MNKQITIALSPDELALIVMTLEQRATRLADRADMTEDEERADYMREVVLQLQKLTDTLRSVKVKR